jgi:hypothetical protein
VKGLSRQRKSDPLQVLESYHVSRLYLIKKFLVFVWRRIWKRIKRKKEEDLKYRVKITRLIRY